MDRSVKVKIRKIILNAKSPASFTNSYSVYKEALRQGIDVTLTEIRDYMKNFYTYQVHRRPTKVQTRRRVLVSSIDSQLDADLMDLTKFMDRNDGYKYLLIAINVFSRKIFAIPLKNKSTDTVYNAMEKILENVSVKRIRTDRGKEFLSNKFGRLMSHHKIKHFVTHDTGNKANYAERAIQTLRGKLYKFMEHNKTNSWIDSLGDIVASYNNTYHSSIKAAPNDVNHRNQSTYWFRQYYSDFGKAGQHSQKLFKGDYVRVVSSRTTFSKAADVTYSREVFRIWRVNSTSPPTFELTDLKGEKITGSFYEKELLKVSRSDTIEKEVDFARRMPDKDAYLVGYKGWPNKFATQVSLRKLRRLRKPHNVNL